jgi:hypothetical protein
MAKRATLVLVVTLLALSGAGLALVWTLAAPIAGAPEALAARHAPAGEAERRPSALERPSSAPATSTDSAQPRSETSSAASVHAAEPERAVAAQPFVAHVRGWTRWAESEVAIPDVPIRFVAGPRVLAQVRSDASGGFEAEFELTGECVLHIDACERWQAFELPLERGELAQAAALPVPLTPPELRESDVITVSGSLLSESGAWSEATLPKTGAVLLDFVSKEDPGRSVRADLVRGSDGDGRPTLEFSVSVAGRGAWELTLSALDGFRWHPPSRTLNGSASGLTFLRYDKERVLPLVFEVSDASSGARIERFDVRRLQTSVSLDGGVFFHTGPIDLGTFPAQGAFQWSLSAEGYAPAFGDERSFEERDGRRVARVALEHGWSTKLFALARNPVAQPLARAEVYADERYVGRTGSDGTLIVSLRERPQKLDVRFSGLKLAGDPLEGYAGRSAERRGQVTLAFLEPVR